MTATSTMARAGVRVTLRSVEDQAAQIKLRLFQDAFTYGQARHWRKMADRFEWARPKPDDFNGQATPEELAARDARLASLARACRWHARLIETNRGAEMAAELAEMLAAEGVV